MKIKVIEIQTDKGAYICLPEKRDDVLSRIKKKAKVLYTTQALVTVSDDEIKHLRGES